MKLIIAEKPSVAKSIASALGAASRADGFYEGNGLIVSWCVGHLVSPMDAASYDERYKKWRYDDLPILPEPFRYVLAPGKEDVFYNLRSLMNRADIDTIINACDAGREGELIFRLVYGMTGCTKPVERLWISSMEDSAIREGFKELRPGSEYDALYHSALCRQKADWLVGINATRLFSVLYHRTLNVGRVQTPTLAMLVERDGKISTFKKEKFHHVRLDLNGTEVLSQRFQHLSQAQSALVNCSESEVVCTSVTKEQKKENPPKLYDLTTLQREANRIFGYTAKQTLEYVQSLYEKKLLTYPRTDSRYLTADMEETATVLVHLAAKLSPFDTCSNFYPLVSLTISDKDVTDHHAIIPTMEIEKANLKILPVGERNLLLLVCCKLLCAVANPHIYDVITATFECGGYDFTVKGKRDFVEGWQQIHRIFLQDLINLTENLDCYEVYSDIDDDDDLGRYYLEEVDVLQIPDYLRGYIDYEAYGRDVRISEGGEYTDFGYVRDSGSRFVEFYNGDREDIPEAYRVMSFETELTDEKRSEWAKDLAFDLDEFFRQHDPVYAAENPDEVAAKQALHDKLFDGKIAAIDQRLAALGQAEGDYLPNRVANYKELTGYEEFLDIDTDALRQAIQNPDPSRVEDMLNFAVKAEQEYAAEAASYVQTPADIIRQAQALQDQPDDHLTGEKVQTPRGSFHLTSLSKEQMEAAGYGVHHNSEDGRYHIMGNGTRAFAIVNAEVREREQQATAKELAVDIDRLCRDHIQGYIHTFPRADYQQEIIAARIMEGETYLFKTQLLNFKQPEATADTIRRLDNFEKDRGIGTYMVYQLKHTEENHLLRFEALDRLYAAEKTVDPANYELVYAGPFTPGETLETIYRDLNVDHPEDYHGYSLSMSDVVVLREYGKDTAHYCDAIGFTEVPQFLNPQQTQEKENPLRTAEMTIEDDYNMIDGVINNGRRDEPQGKPSIRDRLEAAKKECAQQKPPEGKRTGRDTPERSEP